MALLVFFDVIRDGNKFHFTLSNDNEYLRKVEEGDSVTMEFRYKDLPIVERGVITEVNLGKEYLMVVPYKSKGWSEYYRTGITAMVHTNLIPKYV